MPLRSISPSASGGFTACSPGTPVTVAISGMDPSIGFDLIEAEQHAGMQSLLDGTNVAFDFLTARYGRAVRSSQIFGKLGFEVLALFQFLGVGLVLEPAE